MISNDVECSTHERLPTTIALLPMEKSSIKSIKPIELTEIRSLVFFFEYQFFFNFFYSVSISK